MHNRFCEGGCTYSVHNVVVETGGNKVFAYVSWYWDGMLVLDVTDPYNPVEVARYFDNSEQVPRSQQGNPHDFWACLQGDELAVDLRIRPQRWALHIQTTRGRIRIADPYP